MKFTILTKPITIKEIIFFNIKKYGKILLKIKTYGPNSVINSILLGLKELGETNFNINPNINNINNIVFIPNGADVLKSAIILKKKGIIKKIIAGPNISVPLNKDDIIFNSKIDIIITPSQWVKDFLLSLSPLEKRINIWASGIKDTGLSEKKSENLLIYKKQCPDDLFQYIINYLDKNKIKYTIIGYGSFDQKNYIKKLNECIGIIYLQESESQGLSLHEAWIKDIPTLVWNRGFWQNKLQIWNSEKISAPYLTDKCGMYFSGKKDFDVKFNIFIKNIYNFTSREYSLEYFINKITIIKLLSIINK